MSSKTLRKSDGARGIKVKTWGNKRKRMTIKVTPLNNKNNYVSSQSKKYYPYLKTCSNGGTITIKAKND